MYIKNKIVAGLFALVALVLCVPFAFANPLCVESAGNLQVPSLATTGPGIAGAGAAVTLLGSRTAGYGTLWLGVGTPSSTNYAVSAGTTGDTTVNATSGQQLAFALSNSVVGFFNSTGQSITGTYTSTVASGSNGFACSTNGCRVDFGAGASDYATSDGTTISFAGPIASTTFTAAATNGNYVIFNTLSGISWGLWTNSTNAIMNLTAGNTTQLSLDNNASLASFTYPVRSSAFHTLAGLTQTTGHWAAEAVGVSANGATLTGFVTPTTIMGFRNITCDWTAAGSGAGFLSIRIRNITDSTNLCTCTLSGTCATAAGTGGSCDCNSATIAAKKYQAIIDATSTCTTYPTNMICNIEEAI